MTAAGTKLGNYKKKSTCVNTNRLEPFLNLNLMHEPKLFECNALNAFVNFSLLINQFFFFCFLSLFNTSNCIGNQSKMYSHKQELNKNRSSVIFIFSSLSSRCTQTNFYTYLLKRGILQLEGRRIISGASNLNNTHCKKSV